MYKHRVYTRPANRWSHLQRGIGCQAHPLLSNRLTRNHGIHSCSRNRVETRFVVIIVETAIFTWKRLWRHATSRGCVGGNRAKIVGWPTRGIDLPSWRRANRDHVGQSRNSDNGEKESQRFSPRFFRNDFFARDRPSNPVTSFQPKNRVKASVINAPHFFSSFSFSFVCLLFSLFFFYIFRIASSFKR